MGLFQIGSDNGDESENSGAAVVAAVSALILLPLTGVALAAWARPARRLRWSALVVVGLVVGLAALIVGINLS